MMSTLLWLLVLWSVRPGPAGAGQEERCGSHNGRQSNIIISVFTVHPGPLWQRGCFCVMASDVLSGGDSARSILDGWNITVGHDIFKTAAERQRRVCLPRQTAVSDALFMMGGVLLQQVSQTSLYNLRTLETDERQQSLIRIHLKPPLVSCLPNESNLGDFYSTFLRLTSDAVSGGDEEE